MKQWHPALPANSSHAAVKRAGGESESEGQHPKAFLQMDSLQTVERPAHLLAVPPLLLRQVEQEKGYASLSRLVLSAQQASDLVLGLPLVGLGEKSRPLVRLRDLWSMEPQNQPVMKTDISLPKKSEGRTSLQV